MFYMEVSKLFYVHNNSIPVLFEGEITEENTHDFCMAFAQCTNEFGLTLMQRPITITSKSDLKSKVKSVSKYLIYVTILYT